jgi:2-keto-4-pentenoate hydratase/2-oxohepta-3-ene-1,7-dioic acid hydratase in catechol pathway
VIPGWATRTDYEGELGVAIGKKMRYVTEEDVSRCILGCTCFNDVTERHIGSSGLINQDISKCCDSFGPCGPWISTDVDPDNAELKTLLNGTIVQQDNTANTVFSVKRILSELSRFMTLLPGDLVITGTPGGIGPLHAGDVVEVEVAGVGRLGNGVEQENQRQSGLGVKHV